MNAADIHISEEDREKSLNSTKEKKPLYCIAFVDKRSGKGELLYVHATDSGEARMQYMMSEQMKLRHLELVGVSPVIGFHVNDSKGEDLSV